MKDTLFQLEPLEGMKVALDTDNGAASTVPVKSCRPGAQLMVIGKHQMVFNINLNVGSTHPEALQRIKKAGQLSVWPLMETVTADCC